MASSETGIATSIATPCIRTCVVHPTQALCIGCGRSLDEIARWIDLDDTERARIMAQLPARLEAIADATTAGATIAPTPA
jgi:predicted Fe-S protein YdhL (DUF1289 family)